MKRKTLEPEKKDSQVVKERCYEWDCAVCKAKTIDFNIFEISGCSNESIALYVCKDCSFPFPTPRIHYIGSVEVKSHLTQPIDESQDGERIYCPETPERDENEPADNTIIEGTMYTDSFELATQPEETQSQETHSEKTQQEDDLNMTQYESMINLNNTTVSLIDGTECTLCVLCNDATYSPTSQTCGKFYCLNK